MAVYNESLTMTVSYNRMAGWLLAGNISMASGSIDAFP